MGEEGRGRGGAFPSPFPLPPSPFPLPSVPSARDRPTASTRPALVPTHHVELGSHEIGWLGAGAVVFPLESQQGRRHAPHLERGVVLLTLWNRRAPIELTGHDERGSRDVPDVHQG